ncbi:MAG: T9SS type A sorting domain-containing protein [Bacteroidetes bacterium]|jgi:hypothetical protein|nr:T9SS type A sorting domain-containing protein [Bacteroidota bacterium]MBT7143896.1 T9SS type A sorting domain-containing protein [Bacteroidota bacterium]MBT7491251.1 T9SS type A sorting domain-containing protein [Bacteroidota bacterium]
MAYNSKTYIFIIIILLLKLKVAYSQISETNWYKVEETGYFTNLNYSPFGIIASDNYASNIYLIKNNKYEILHSSPSCGRYYNLSPDGSKIAFKMIDQNRMQAPAVIDITSKKVRIFSNFTQLCGQPNFTNKGKVFYTIADTLFFEQKNKFAKFCLYEYSNITDISPDEQKLVFSHNGQLFLFSFESKKIIQITDNKGAYLYPKWSPDGKKLLFSSVTGKNYVWEKAKSKIYEIGDGNLAVWTLNSEFLIFIKSRVMNFRFLGSDIFISKFDGSLTKNLSNTKDVNEAGVQIFGDNKLIFHTLENREIYEAIFDIDNFMLKDIYLILKSKGKLPIEHFHFNKLTNSGIFIDTSKVPYVHQVYDTPDWHDGSGSCAPATAVMAIAFYNRLPKWETQISYPSPHISHYGSYVSELYRFNEIYYEVYANAYGTDAYGGYGYMWNGSSSPSSKMKQYYENHGINSDQLWLSSCTFQNTANEIDNGYPHTICSWLTQSGHLTLAVGYIPVQQTLIFRDPFGNKNTPNYPSYDGQLAYYDWPGFNNGFQNLDADGTHGGVAWTLKSRSEFSLYNDTIIDDIFYDNGFYIFNQPPSHQKYFRDNFSGYNDHSWFTITVDYQEDICWVSWTPNLPDSGIYEVSAFIPPIDANAENSLYKIQYSGGDTTISINQGNYSDEWVSLGFFPFAPGDSNYVYLGDNTGIQGQSVAFDAIKWSRTFTSFSENIYQEKNTVSIFPNPCNDILNISYSINNAQKVELNIYSILGINKFSSIFTPQNSDINQIELNIKEIGLSDGNYILELKNEEFSIREKVLVLHILSEF